MSKLTVDPDIRVARTLPAVFYRDEEYFIECREKIFRRTWHFAGDTDTLKSPGTVYPFRLYDDFMDEPLLFTRGHDDRLYCISNVCTHRGNLLAEGLCNEKNLRCRYHGRKFSLDGKFISMPEFEGALNFPGPQDDLPAVPFDILGKLLFVSLRPAAPLQAFLGEITERLAFIDHESMKFDAARSKDYLVKCNWALYCENYLEGFHIPFVHSGLNSILDYSQYRTELFDFSSLQLGIGRTSEAGFDLPKGHKDEGLNVSAYYYWIFPNLMLNFYPWGLSVNIVRPVRRDLTKVTFLSYVSDESVLSAGAGAALDKVEREDEAIVENVQAGIRSSLYESGRYSPEREQGVHHFHRLLCDFMN